MSQTQMTNKCPSFQPKPKYILTFALKGQMMTRVEKCSHRLLQGICNYIPFTLKLQVTVTHKNVCSFHQPIGHMSHTKYSHQKLLFYTHFKGLHRQFNHKTHTTYYLCYLMFHNIKSSIKQHTTGHISNISNHRIYFYIFMSCVKSTITGHSSNINSISPCFII